MISNKNSCAAVLTLVLIGVCVIVILALQTMLNRVGLPYLSLEMWHTIFSFVKVIIDPPVSRSIKWRCLTVSVHVCVFSEDGLMEPERKYDVELL